MPRLLSVPPVVLALLCLTSPAQAQQAASCDTARSAVLRLRRYSPDRASDYAVATPLRGLVIAYVSAPSDSAYERWEQAVATAWRIDSTQTERALALMLFDGLLGPPPLYLVAGAYSRHSGRAAPLLDNLRWSHGIDLAVGNALEAIREPVPATDQPTLLLLACDATTTFRAFGSEERLNQSHSLRLIIKQAARLSDSATWARLQAVVGQLDPAVREYYGLDIRERPAN